MSKALTIEAIEASAIEVFCRDGFDRASLREIAGQAGVALSAIHEYFDSKADLYIHVGRRLFTRLEAKRRAILEGFRASGEAIDLAKIIYCMVAPVVLPGTADDRAWTPARLRTWYDTTSYLGDYPAFRDELRSTADSWIELMLEHCPALGYAEGRFAHALISAVTFNWEMTNRYFTDALKMAGRHAPDEECERVVRVIAAGIRDLSGRVG